MSKGGGNVGGGTTFYPPPGQTLRLYEPIWPMWRRGPRGAEQYPPLGGVCDADTWQIWIRMNTRRAEWYLLGKQIQRERAEATEIWRA